MGAARRSTSPPMRPSIPKLIAAALALALSAALVIPADSMPVSHVVARAEPIDPATAAPSIAPPVKANNPKRQDAAPKNEAEEEWTFDITSPEPYDIWTSGTVTTLSWMDINLPPKATFDIALIPVDPETNPKATEMTRRPILRYISTMARFLDIVVPYNLITKEQLLKEQEGEGGAVVEASASGHGTIPTNATKATTATTANPPTETSENDIQSQARLFITAYDGRTNKVLAQKSIFPIIIKKDHVLDWRTVPILPLPSPSVSSAPAPSTTAAGEQEPEDSDELLAKKDSENTHLEDHVYKAEDINDDEDSLNNHTPDANEDGAVKNEAEEEIDLNGMTPTGLELGVNSGANEDDSSEMESMDHQQEHEHSHEHGDGEGEGEDEDEDEHEHGHSHVIDPNHFQNEEDIELWKQHEDDPGYNPPIKIEDAGTIQITRWIDNKERFFVGAPYVFAWEFPQDAAEEGLTGEVNVYVEDAFTAKRYDIIAGAMSSEIRFMHLHPTKIMMSVDPQKRIYLRARVELDLFKNGNIRRYTGFSKAFWVERGAL